MADTPASMTFDVELEAGGPRGRNLAVVLPSDPKAVFGTARAPVAVHLDDHPPFPTTLAVMGGRWLFGLRQDQIAELDLAAGQTVHVRLVHDTAPRTVELPAELEVAFAAAADARRAYDTLTASQRKEFARWVATAAKQQTRDARTAAALGRLRAGHTTPR